MKIFGITGIIALMMVSQIRAATVPKAAAVWAVENCKHISNDKEEVQNCINCALKTVTGIVSPECKRHG